MRKRDRIQVSVLLLFLGLLAAVPVTAEVVLRFTPPDQTIPLGGSGSLSVMLDDTLDVRTVEVLAQYDAGVLLSVAGNPGQLFIDTGCLLFKPFVDEPPGEWYGVVVILGADCWLTGPGELYRWDFEGIGNGYSAVTAFEVRLYDPEANLIADVSLEHAYVFVGDGTGMPAAGPAQLHLDLHPNPFNPSTRVSFGAPVAGPAFLEVFDLSGRRLAEIWRGTLDGSDMSVVWDGRDMRGRELSSGVYLLRLRGADGRSASRRAVLLR